MVRRTPGAQFVESVLRDCFAAKRFGVNRFWILVCIMAEQEWNKIEQSRTKVEKVGIKR